MNRFAPMITLGILGLFGCKGDEDTAETGTVVETGETGETGTEATLWDQLGGDTGVNAVLDAFLGHVAADARINFMFVGGDLARLKTQLHDQLCQLTGGGCTYTGANMATVHADMAITTAQFNALVEDLYLALDDLDVPYSSDPATGTNPMDAVIVVLAGTASDIVTDPAGTTILFNRIGGIAGVTAVVGTFATNVLADTAINARFSSTNMTTLGGLLTLQLCEATGGYCTYTGQTMAAAHASMSIDLTEFNALAGDMQAALVTHNVTTTDQATIMGVLGGMCGDIVTDTEAGACP